MKELEFFDGLAKGLDQTLVELKKLYAKGSNVGAVYSSLTEARHHLGNRLADLKDAAKVAALAGGESSKDETPPPPPGKPAGKVSS